MLPASLALLILVLAGCGVREERVKPAPPPPPDKAVAERYVWERSTPPPPPPVETAAGVAAGPSLCRRPGFTWMPRSAATTVAPLAAGGWRVQCLFGKRPGERAYVDAALRQDLRDAAGFTLRFRCADTAAVNRFFLYFKSGEGWYGATFTPAGRGDWETITVWKHATFIEGPVQGWGRVDTIRISATPAASRDLAFEIADVRTIPGTPDAVILRNTGALGSCSATEARSLTDFTQRLGDALVRAGLRPISVDDADLAGGWLESRKAKILLLPYTVSMPPTTRDAVARHLAAGGAVGGFFNPPVWLADRLGIRTGPYVSATQIPGGFTAIRPRPGTLNGAPDTVAQASWIIQEQQPASAETRAVAFWAGENGAATKYPAILLNPNGFWMSHVYLDNDPEAGARLFLALLSRWSPNLWRDAARTALARNTALENSAAPEARALMTKAKAALEAGEYPQVITLADQARTAAGRTWLAALPALSGEVRGAWCHRPYGITGQNWEKTARDLQAAGFNTLYANLAWPGAAAYPSRVLPVSPLVKTNGDLLRQCADACARHGLNLHVWLACLNLGDSAPKDWGAALVRDGRCQVGRDGKTEPRWLCPAHPANRKLLIDAAAELASFRGLAGIHLDFIRYQDSNHCFCTLCRKEFEASIGRRIARWPADIETDAKLNARWLDYRRRTVTTLVRDLAAAVRARNPQLKLSAAVYDNFASARDSVAQDTVDWCRNGWLDWVCPMDYIVDTDQFEDRVRRQHDALAGTRARIYPGIGTRASRLTAVQTAEQILATRRQGTGGFTIFEYNADEARAIFPELARGPTRP